MKEELQILSSESQDSGLKNSSKVHYLQVPIQQWGQPTFGHDMWGSTYKRFTLEEPGTNVQKQKTDQEVTILFHKSYHSSIFADRGVVCA